jgi:hypothetical protein
MIALVAMNVLVAFAEQPVPKLQPNMIPTSKAANPAPGPGAQDRALKTSVGKGSLMMFAKQPVYSWQEQVTLNGGAVTTDFLFNSDIGVLYGYREGDFKCSNGQTVHGSVVEALYTSGNKSGKPPGSGWWAVELNAGKCDAGDSAIYGCKFDASGNATECGTATVHNVTGEIDLVAVQ